MEVRSLYRYARISPLKARDVAREIQGLPVSHALDILTFTPRKAALLIGKTLKSALANAENNHNLAVDGLVVKEAVVNDGPTFKRFKPRARGSAGAIRKRTSHITIVLTDDSATEEPKEKAKSKKTAKKAAKAVEQAPAPAPEVETEEAPAAAPPANLGRVYDSAPDQIDDLKQISGVGPQLEEKLHGFGVYQFAQIAEWGEEQVAAFDDLLNFKGRIERDNWIEQATGFAAGDGGEATSEGEEA